MPIGIFKRQRRLTETSLLSYSNKVLIGIISDTHVPDHAKGLPANLKDVFHGVDLILHGGDIYIPRVLDDLETIAPVTATWGDDDLKSDLGTDARMTRERTLHLDGITMWLIHVRPSYQLISPGEGWYPSKLDAEVPKETPQVVVSGHTHTPSIEEYKGILLVNPGSATFPGYVSRPGTVALLTLNPGKLEAKIIQLE